MYDTKKYDIKNVEHQKCTILKMCDTKNVQ